MQVYCYNDKTSSAGTHWDAVRTRNEAEVEVDVPDVEGDEDGEGSVLSRSSRGGRGPRRSNSGTRGNQQTPAAVAAAAVAAAAAAAASSLSATPTDPRKDPEYRRQNDLNPETRRTFNLKDWTGVGKQHKRIVSYYILPFIIPIASIPTFKVQL